MSLFSFLSKESSALLVIDNNVLQILQFEEDNHVYKLTGFNEVSLEDDIVREGNIIDMNAFKPLLAELFSEAKPQVINAKKLYVNIPYNLLYSFVGDFPNNTKEVFLQKAMTDKLKSHSPVPIEELSLDFASEKHGHEISYAVYASPKKWQERLLRACKKVGVKSIEFVPESVAYMHLIKEPFVEDGALFSCHKSKISLSVLHSGLLYDSFNISDFTQDTPLDCSAHCELHSVGEQDQLPQKSLQPK